MSIRTLLRLNISIETIFVMFFFFFFVYDNQIKREGNKKSIL